MQFTIWGNTYVSYAWKSRAVIVDYDGTLSDGSHRLHLLPTKDLHLTESWSEFNRASINDAPIRDTIDVVNSLHEAGYCVIILTGRSDEVMADSIKWLIDNGVNYDHIIMRRSLDNRKDTIIKEEVLRAIGLDNILCAFDDSPGVIQHFRSLGITTYAVTQYDKPRDDLKSHGVDELKPAIECCGDHWFSVVDDKCIRCGTTKELKDRISK